SVSHIGRDPARRYALLAEPGPALLHQVDLEDIAAGLGRGDDPDVDRQRLGLGDPTGERRAEALAIEPPPVGRRPVVARHDGMVAVAAPFEPAVVDDVTRQVERGAWREAGR